MRRSSGTEFSHRQAFHATSSASCRLRSPASCVPAAYSLQSATLHAAQVLGVDDQGVIEAGKRADIIAMPGDPLADIGNVMKVDFVMKDGVVYREPAR